MVANYSEMWMINLSKHWTFIMSIVLTIQLEVGVPKKLFLPCSLIFQVICYSLTVITLPISFDF